MSVSFEEVTYHNKTVDGYRVFAHFCRISLSLITTTVESVGCSSAAAYL